MKSLDAPIQMRVCMCNSPPVMLEKITDFNNRYCNQDEANDPNPVFEEYLTCVACGDNGT